MHAGVTAGDYHRDMDDAAPPLTTEVLHAGHWLRLVRRGRWESCERVHGDGMAVVILAETPDGRVLFVEQHRVALGARTIEFPAGLVGDLGDEDTLDAAAHRELVEETGWRAARMQWLLTGPSSGGMSNERLAFLLAHGLEQVGPGGGDASEDIQVHAIPHREVPRWLLAMRDAGRELDPKLWAGLWLLEHHMDGSPRRASAP
jgi:ADP-ribose pyrophosphatase